METVRLGEQSEGHEDGLSRINVKSDFPLAMKLIKNGQEVPFPETDFSVTARTEGGFLVYKAGRKNGICKHCKQDGDRMIIFFDNHGLGKGRVVIECVIDTPDADYTEDGIRQEVYKAKSPIVLVDDDGDALDLRLPEPRVVEKVVEKEIDHYTDLQKKAAEWVTSVLNNEEDDLDEKAKTDILGYILGNVHSIYPISRAAFKNSIPLMNGTHETDPDFGIKLEITKIAFTLGLGKLGQQAFYQMDAPNLDLKLNFFFDCPYQFYQVFAESKVNSLTLDVEEEDELVSNIQDIAARVQFYKDAMPFYGLSAKKLTILNDSSSHADKGWIFLASLEDTNIECVEAKYKSNIQKDKFANNDRLYSIDYIIDNILADVSSSETKPRLIFRNYKGVATEELKQKVLAKGYPSVEFYLGDEKML